MHVSLYVKNIEDTVNFYNKFFGQSADKIKSDYAKYVLDEPALIISFVQNPQRVADGFGHLGFQVQSEDELQSRLVQAKEAGLTVLEEIGTACCYALQDKYWVEDPDGYRWEVYYFHEDSEFNDPRYQSSEVCCMPTSKEKKKLSLADLGQKSTCC